MYRPDRRISAYTDGQTDNVPTGDQHTRTDRQIMYRPVTRDGYLDSEFIVSMSTVEPDFIMTVEIATKNDRYNWNLL